MLERRPPERAFLHGLALAAGVGYLTFAPRPASVSAVIPRWMLFAWAASLAVSGAVGLWTFFRLARRKPLSARLYGRFAVRLQGAGISLWLLTTVATWYETTPRPPFPYFGVLVFGGWAATIIARDRQLASEINAITGDGGRHAGMGRAGGFRLGWRRRRVGARRAVPGAPGQADDRRRRGGLDREDVGGDGRQRQPGDPEDPSRR